MPKKIKFAATIRPHNKSIIHMSFEVGGLSGAGSKPECSKDSIKRLATTGDNGELIPIKLFIKNTAVPTVN